MMMMMIVYYIYVHTYTHIYIYIHTIWCSVWHVGVSKHGGTSTIAMFNREKMIKFYQDWWYPILRQTLIKAFMFWSNLGKHKAPSACFFGCRLMSTSIVLSLAAVEETRWTQPPRTWVERLASLWNPWPSWRTRDACQRSRCPLVVFSPCILLVLWSTGAISMQKV